jgi:hypothetical protein
MNFSTVPPCRSITARAASKYRRITCRKLSGSSHSPKAVDSVTSQNSTVTVLRCSAEPDPPPALRRTRCRTWHPADSSAHT